MGKRRVWPDEGRSDFVRNSGHSTNIFPLGGHDLNVIVQIERRPGIRFVSGVLEIRGFDIESETYQFESVYSR
jgi:hypothetical protein